MPIYQPNEYEEVLKRIKQKIHLLQIEMESTLTEKEIQQFEKQCNISLPEAYRRFLKEVGNGCKMLAGFRLNRLENTEREDLSLFPFAPEEAWIWEDENVSAEHIKQMVCHGNLELVDIGDGMSYNLIVHGKCRGEVWNFTDVGVQPCCERQDFLGWFELWLDEQENVDYFKDYTYP